jgi:hypothetical protein
LLVRVAKIAQFKTVVYSDPVNESATQLLEWTTVKQQWMELENDKEKKDRDKEKEQGKKDGSTEKGKGKKGKDKDKGNKKKDGDK